MTRYLAIIENTIREGFAKKTIIVILVLVTIIIGFFLLAFNVAEDTLFIFGQEIDEQPEYIIRNVEGGVVAFFYQVSLFIGVFAISSFLPAMQEKGTVDLLLSRPMSRVNIYSAKFIGCLFLVLVMIVYLIVGTWLVIGVKTGYYHVEYLYTIPIFMLQFFSFMGFIAMIGIMSRNTTTSAITAIFVPFIFSAILFGFHKSQLLRGSRFWYNFFEFFYWILPKTPELTAWNIVLIDKESMSFTDIDLAIWTTFAFGVACFIVGAAIFQRRSY
jgi:ABC-type transport system involved in multi-copper enzyme maturation permease subunit